MKTKSPSYCIAFTSTVVLLLCAITGCGSNNTAIATSPSPTPVPPSATFVSPSVLAVGSPNTNVIVTGSGFLSTSSLLVNGIKIGTVFQSSTQLLGSVPAPFLAVPGTLQISVVNSASSGNNSGIIALSVVTVAALSLLATPVDSGAADGPWTLSAVAVDPTGQSISKLPVVFSASTGSLSGLADTTGSNGVVSETITPPLGVGSAPLVVTAITGTQTAAVNIVFQNSSTGAARLRALSEPRKEVSTSSTFVSNIQPFVIGTSGTPSSTNPFITPDNCYTNEVLVTTITIACQQLYGQNNLHAAPSNLINQTCKSLETTQNIASCAGAGVTVVACLLPETGVGAAICAGVLGDPLLFGAVQGLAVDCVEFIATLLTRRFLGNAAAEQLNQVFLLQDPASLTNIIPVACTAVQDLFPPSGNVAGGRVYVADSSTNVIKVYDSQGTIVNVTGSFPSLSTPDGMAYDPSNRHIYVANLGNNTVTAYDLEGNLVDLGLNAFAGLNDPEDITFDPLNKHFYINEPAPNQVVVFDENGSPISLPAGAFANLSSPFGLGWNSANSFIYVTNSGNNTVTVYDQSGNQIQTTVGAFAGLNSPDDVSWDPVTGNLYITGAASDGLGGCSVNQIFVYTPDGTAVLPSGGFLGLNGPDAVVSNGNAAAPMYYVTNICGGSVSAFDRSGAAISLPLGAFGGLIQPTGVLVVP